LLQRGPIPGPIIRFADVLQEKLFVILYYIDTWSEQLVKSVCFVCQHHLFPISSVLCVLNIAKSRQGGERMLDWNTYFSFKLSCLLGISQFELQELNSLPLGPAGMIVEPSKDKVMHYNLEK
jgi:hypothetical protein